MPQLVASPVTTVSADTSATAITFGHSAGAKPTLNTNAASAQLAPSASATPVTPANTPSNNYSTTKIRRICARDAPSVRSKMLS